jgi:hypothetical protein
MDRIVRDRNQIQIQFESLRDLVTGMSPGFGHVELKGSDELKDAIPILDW